MIDLFFEGGVLFMSILTILLITVFISFFKCKDKIKLLGTLALSVGILGSLIVLYSAFITIQEVGNASPAILAGGLRVASICTIYGLVIYIISLILECSKK